MRRPLTYQAYQASNPVPKQAASGISVAAAWANPTIPAQLAVMSVPSNSLPGRKRRRKK
jgi:hypothetical protein